MPMVQTSVGAERRAVAEFARREHEVDVARAIGNRW